MATKIDTRQPARLACYIALALAAAPDASARETFNAELVELDNPGMGKADLSAFESGSQAPGTYRVDIILNERLLETRDVAFVQDGADRLQPCLSVAQLKAWGVKTALFPQVVKPNSPCASLEAIPDARADFQFGAQRLVLSIPQAAVSLPARGEVSPELWDEGITVAMLNYSLNGANAWAHAGESTGSRSQYANLRPGINVGPWRLRSYSTWTRGDDGQNAWDTVYSYAQRAIIPLQAQLTLGDSSAPADVFDSVPFRGVQLASDDDMLPDSLKGYAPVVRGIARTNAQVTVRQNGYQIYQTFVAPGAFEITDMYPTGGAGDLDVTVLEADGSEQRFTLPYASLPVLQREGRGKYALTGGQYRSWNSGVDKAAFVQASGIYGLPQGVTAYGGAQSSGHYRALALGLGKNMGEAGALSADVTQGWSALPDGEKSGGQSWRVRYSKTGAASGTQLTVAGYRFSSRGYYSMQEVLDAYGDGSAPQEQRKNRVEVTIGQALGDDAGALTISAAREAYWDAGRSTASYSLGYNNAWRGLSYGLTWTYSHNASAGGEGHQTQGDSDRLLAFNLSVPLDKFLPQAWASYGLTASRNSGATHGVGLNGVALENRALSWSAQQGYGTRGAGATGNLSADYKGTYGEATTGYGYDQNGQRLNYGLQGGVLLHEDGVTFSQPLGETNALVKAPGAHDVDIRNQPGVRTDYRGYTAVSNLSNYRTNDLSLAPETMPGDVELEMTTRTVIPTRGAVVKAEYLAKVGHRVLMSIIHRGQFVPFGAIVAQMKGGENGGIVGDSGQVYLAGLQTQGSLFVTWGAKAGQQCRAPYVLPARSRLDGIAEVNVNCV
ncbi:TPA: fimbria/pilus outer membrane usher protein [Enterobacter cancerogenus]